MSDERAVESVKSENQFCYILAHAFQTVNFRAG